MNHTAWLHMCQYVFSGGCQHYYYLGRHYSVVGCVKPNKVPLQHTHSAVRLASISDKKYIKLNARWENILVHSSHESEPFFPGKTDTRNGVHRRENETAIWFLKPGERQGAAVRGSWVCDTGEIDGSECK